MCIRFYRRGMVPVFPISPVSVLPVVVLLRRPSGNQLQALGDHPGTTVLDQEMDVIGGDDIVEYA